MWQPLVAYILGYDRFVAKLKPRVPLTVTMLASPHAHTANTGTSSDNRVANPAKHRFRLKIAFLSDLP